jgi:1,2-diacylglycerol 3-beta-galactosyltransferase
MNGTFSSFLRGESMHKKRILILTSDAGFGHRSAAYAIEAALRELFGSQCECKVINPTDNADTPKLIQQLEGGYDEMVVDTPELYRLSYYTLDAPLVSDVVRTVMAWMLNDVMYELIEGFRPHVVVSTYPFYAKSAAKVIEELAFDCPLAIVITDLTDVQSLWYSPLATMHFVPTPLIRQQAYENNVPATRVRVTGLPVNPEISGETRSPSELRTELGWEQEIPTCLVVASPRTQEMAKISQLLDQIPDLQVVVVCGGNSQLCAKLEQPKWQGPVQIYDWVDNMPQLMKASDFVVSKAGGLIVSEALASGLPMIISEALPGQETGNMHYVVENHAGAWAPGPAEVLATAISWLRDDHAQLRVFQSNAQDLGKPRAAYHIAKGLWGLSGGR